MDGQRCVRMVIVSIWGAAMMGWMQGAAADDDERRIARVPLLPLYQQECSACHVAYPPGLLPAPSWNRLLNNLPRHFGSDASLDAKTVKEISRWLTAHAAPADRRHPQPPEDRITRSAWFTEEHDEISPAVWRRKAIGSPSNCMACHTRADQGIFNEHDIRIPR